MKLHLTNGYKPYFDQISRIMQYLADNSDRSKIPTWEIENALGMSDLQVKFWSSTSVAFGLFEPRSFVLTNIGKLVAEKDVFFEKIDTLWIIHYIASSEPQWIVWYRMFNEIIPFNDQISIEQSVPYFSDLALKYSKRTMKEDVANEIGVVLWSYTKSPLSKLGILHEYEPGIYRKGTTIDITPLAFLFCVLFYFSNKSINATAMTISEICTGKDSPGLVLNIPEYQVRGLLEKLHDTKIIRLEQLGDLDQVRFSQGLSKEQVLQRIYEA
jgi:hypothetical protein